MTQEKCHCDDCSLFAYEFIYLQAYRCTLTNSYFLGSYPVFQSKKHDISPKEFSFTNRTMRNKFVSILSNTFYWDLDIEQFWLFHVIKCLNRDHLSKVDLTLLMSCLIIIWQISNACQSLGIAKNRKKIYIFKKNTYFEEWNFQLFQPTGLLINMQLEHDFSMSSVEK